MRLSLFWSAGGLARLVERGRLARQSADCASRGAAPLKRCVDAFTIAGAAKLPRTLLTISKGGSGDRDSPIVAVSLSLISVRLQVFAHLCCYLAGFPSRGDELVGSGWSVVDERYMGEKIAAEKAVEGRVFGCTDEVRKELQLDRF